MHFSNKIALIHSFFVLKLSAFFLLKLVHACCCLPELQAVKLTFLAPWSCRWQVATCTRTGKHEVWIAIQCIAVRLSQKITWLSLGLHASFHPSFFSFSNYQQLHPSHLRVNHWNKVTRYKNKLLVCFVFFIVTLATNLKVTKGLLNYYYEIFGIIMSSHLTHLPRRFCGKTRFEASQAVFWCSKELKHTTKPFTGCTLRGLLI